MTRLLSIFLLLAAPLKIAPVTTTIDIKGQPIKITAWGTVSQSHLALTADLGELQQNIGAVLAAQLNRSDRCGERLTVESATLQPASPAAILIAHVHAERWACAKAFGRDIVKRLVGGNAVVTVKLTPSAGPDGIAINSEVQKIDADGSLGELLRSGSMGDALKQKIAGSIESSIRKGLDLKSTLPPTVASAVTLRSAQFTPGDAGRLWISVEGEVSCGAATPGQCHLVIRGTNILKRLCSGGLLKECNRRAYFNARGTQAG